MNTWGNQQKKFVKLSWLVPPPDFDSPNKTKTKKKAII